MTNTAINIKAYKRWRIDLEVSYYVIQIEEECLIILDTNEVLHAHLIVNSFRIYTYDEHMRFITISNILFIIVYT